MDPIKRAASIITGAMQFRDLIVNETLEPESTKQGPICSEQYKYLFNATRIPKIPNDITRLSDPETNNHIIVMRKNQFYKVELVQNGIILSTTEIEGYYFILY
jgi:carnitine O-acetyltransferase